MKTKICKLTLLLAVLMSTIEIIAQNNDSTTQPSQNDENDYSKKPTVTCDSTFQLSSFQLPEYRRRVLTTRYSLSNDMLTKNQYYFDKYVYPSFENEIESKQKDMQNTLNLYGNVDFSDIFYTRKHQKETYFYSNFTSNIENYKTNVDLNAATKRNFLQLSPYVIYGQTHRHYLSENWYIGYAPSIQYNCTYRRDVSKNNNENNKSNTLGQNIKFDIPLEVGHGRIEPIGDARHAIYIFDALAHQGLIEAPKSSEDITRFAVFIAKLKNKRYLDARHRRIYEMEALDSFLVANHYSDTPNMRYYTTLEDFWGYGNVNRQSGSRWAFFTTPEYSLRLSRNKSYMNDTIQTDTYDNTNILNTTFGVSFTYENPINLYWQNSLRSSLTYIQSNTRTMYKNHLADEKRVLYAFSGPGLRYALSQRISYYPTTRTTLYTSYGVDYHFSKTRHTTVSLFTHYLRANGGAGATYYFSPQLQLNMNASLYYDYLYENQAMRYENTAHDRRTHLSEFNFFFEILLNYTFY